MNQNQTDHKDDSFSLLDNWQIWLFTSSSTTCAVIAVVGQGMIIQYIIKYASKERPINKLVLIDQVCNINHEPLALDASLVPKVSKRHFSRYQEFLSWGNSNGSRTTPKFFKFSFQQIWSLEEFKLSAY